MIHTHHLEQPTVFSSTVSNNAADGNSNTIRFYITPTVTIPALGFFKILFPDEFPLAQVTSISFIRFSQSNHLALDCDVNTNGGGLLTSYACYKKNQLVTLQLNVDQMTLGVESWIEMDNFITNPIYPGFYTFDILVLGVDGLTVL